MIRKRTQDFKIKILSPQKLELNLLFLYKIKENNLKKTVESPKISNQKEYTNIEINHE